MLMSGIQEPIISRASQMAEQRQVRIGLFEVPRRIPTLKHNKILVSYGTFIVIRHTSAAKYTLPSNPQNYKFGIIADLCSTAPPKPKDISLNRKK